MYCTRTLSCCQRAVCLTVWKVDSLHQLVPFALCVLYCMSLYGTAWSHSRKHNVREDPSGIRVSNRLDCVGPGVHLVGLLLGDQQPRDINKAVNTNCQGDGRKRRLIFHSPWEVCPGEICPPLHKITPNASLESLKGRVTDTATPDYSGVSHEAGKSCIQEVLYVKIHQSPKVGPPLESQPHGGFVF